MQFKIFKFLVRNLPEVVLRRWQHAEAVSTEISNRLDDNDLSTLKYLIIIMKHGDRLPDLRNAYPTSPYLQKNFYPYDAGELSRDGQIRMYHNGMELRKRYDCFLGDVFYQQMVKATTSSYKYCQMSLQCTLAGLFPPNDKQAMCPGMPWQPVPYEVIPFHEDKYIAIDRSCPDLFDIVYDHERDAKHCECFDYLKEHTGYTCNIDYLQTWRIQHFSRACIENALCLPAWLQPMWPEVMDDLVFTWWEHFLCKRKRIGAGNLIQRITQQAQDAADTTFVHKGCTPKVALYVVHDMNMHLVRDVLGVWDREHVQNGAYLIFELHRLQNVDGFKIFYVNKCENPQLLKTFEKRDFVHLTDFKAKTSLLYKPEECCEDIEMPHREKPWWKKGAVK